MVILLLLHLAKNFNGGGSYGLGGHILIVFFKTWISFVLQPLSISFSSTLGRRSLHTIWDGGGCTIYRKERKIEINRQPYVIITHQRLPQRITTLIPHSHITHHQTSHFFNHPHSSAHRSLDPSARQVLSTLDLIRSVYPFT